MSEQYTYAVARIRALEVSLFSDSTIDQLIACQSYDQALQFLEEKGWGDTESSGDAEKILTREEEKTVCGSQEKKHTRHFFIPETGSSVT